MKSSQGSSSTTIPEPGPTQELPVTYTHNVLTKVTVLKAFHAVSIHKACKTTNQSDEGDTAPEADYQPVPVP